MSPSAVHPVETRIVDTTLNHYLDPADGGHTKYIPGTASFFRRKFNERAVKITDIRGREDEFDLNTQGFQFHASPSIGGDFSDPDKIKKEVYPETERLLKDITGATRVIVFSHILRNNSKEEVMKKVETDPALADDNAQLDVVVPASFIHIDQSNHGAVLTLEQNVHPPELADKLQKTRWSIINTWRPIKPVFKDPLAMCDARSVDERDLVTVPVSFPAKDSGMRYADITEGDELEVFYLRYNPDHKWYYQHGMAPGECLFIKCFDTINDGGTARRVPHSAFHDPTNTDSTIRESVELRSLVFYEDQPLEGH